MRRAGPTARKSLDPASVWCARLDRDPAHSAHGFGQQVASLVLWFGLGDWVIDRIDTGATRTLMGTLKLQDWTLTDEWVGS